MDATQPLVPTLEPPDEGPTRTGGPAGSGFRYPLDVRFFEVDSLGVVFNMWYLGWCDEAMSAFMESVGYGYATLRAGGLDAVLRRADLEWLDSLQAFQHAEVAVRVDNVGRTSFRLRFDINRVDIDPVDIDPVDIERADIERADIERVDINGADISAPGVTPCAHATITYVCVGIEGRKTAPIPPDLREALVAGNA
jgi:acyl-CoA thioester hydrolase